MEKFLIGLLVLNPLLSYRLPEKSIPQSYVKLKKRKSCKSCEGSVRAMSFEKALKIVGDIPEWQIDAETPMKIFRNFSFVDFAEAMEFVTEVAQIAEYEGHHPDISISWNKVGIDLYTYALNGLSENDFILAKRINEMWTMQFKGRIR